MKVGSAECAVVNWKPWHGHLHCATHLSLGASCNDTLISVQHSRKTGSKEERRARVKPPHRTSWANNTMGGQTLRMAGGREGAGACHLVMMFTTGGNQVEGKLLTLFLFFLPRGKQKQRETQQVICESVRFFFPSQWGFSRLFNYCWKLVSTIYQLTSNPREQFCG